MSYAAPTNAKTYLLKHAVGLEDVLSLPAYENINEELVTDILSGAASFAEDILAPINQNGDLNPATLEGDDVIASPGFKEAYKDFVEAGWLSLGASEAIGGAGLPAVVSVSVNEMIYAANMALSLIHI